MNSTPNNNLNPLTPEEISNLHGQELVDALAKQRQMYKTETDRIDGVLSKISDEVENTPDVDQQQARREDDEALAKIEVELDNSLNDAILDLATTDEVLKDIPKEGEEEGIEK